MNPKAELEMAEKKMIRPTISIIIPVYNMEKYLRQCLDSILNQTSKDIEIIAIDDGSVDCSGAILDEYAAVNPCMRVVHKSNGGVASARNLGLEYVTGKYVAWIDPDDYVSGNWYLRIKEIITSVEPDVIVMDSLRVGSGECKQEVYGRQEGFVDAKLFMSDVIRDYRMLSGLPNKIIKAEFFQGLQFDTSLTILEDYALMPRLLQTVQTVYYIAECLYIYRQHESSLIHSVPDERAFTAVKLALDRSRAVTPEFEAAGIGAVAVQALIFCRSHYLSPSFGKREELRFCIRFFRENLMTLLKDKEFSRYWRMKFLLLSTGGYGLLVRIRNRNKMKREVA